MAALAGCAAALPIGIAGAAAFAAGPQRGSARSGIPPSLAGRSSHFVLMWAMIFLPSYTMGGIGAGRLLNVVWMTFVQGLAATEFLLLGWLERVRGVSLHRAERFCQHHARRLPLAVACMLVVMACIGSHTVKEGQDNYFATSLEAAHELADGQAQRYAAALDERETILTDEAQPEVSIRPLNEEDERPWLLFYTDVAPGRTCGA